jgi:hypothetical protein
VSDTSQLVRPNWSVDDPALEDPALDDPDATIDDVRRRHEARAARVVSAACVTP